MSNPNYIHSCIRLKNGKALLNNQAIFETNAVSISDFLKELYLHLQIDYPKFYKMDELCKLAFVGTEIVMKNSHEIFLQKEDTAVVLANLSSSLETDKKFEESIQDEQHYFPSPAVFVYTLPNITIGEIMIRNNFKGENTFFVSEKYDVDFMSYYVNSLLQNNSAKRVLSGWVESGVNSYDAFIYIATSSKAGISLEHTKENINILYNS
ncbi:MAG TPA: hypothetical protein VK766_07565 [Cytophagaceae bacterium]|jgi:hypothetical protein|nr:hypothetical protein [Cytophagaceae bacterium]